LNWVPKVIAARPLAIRFTFRHLCAEAAGGKGRAGKAKVTIPNIITILRFLLVPGVVFALLTGNMGWALAGFLVAGISDGIDGFIARQFNQRSELGAYLDPMADKLLLVTMFVMLTLPGIGSANRLPLWFTILVISRDIAIVLTVAVINLAVGPRTFRPSIFGKIATATYIVTGVVTLYFNYLGYRSPLVMLFVYASLAITFVSAFHYLIQVVKD
jgi:cardiolipin synthase (CMP-forming)